LVTLWLHILAKLIQPQYGQLAAYPKGKGKKQKLLS